MAILGTAGRVGLVVLVGMVLLAGMFAFFSGGSFFHPTYTIDVLFDNADSIIPNAPVELAGVQIGQVKRVSLTSGQKADLTLEIKQKLNGQPVNIPTGSQFVITVAILGGTGVIMVIPPDDAAKRPNDFIPDGAKGLNGIRTGDITASLSRANTLLDQLTVTTRRVDALLADPRLQNNLQQAVANLNTASAGGVKLTQKLNGTIDADNRQLNETLLQDNTHVQRLLDADNAQLQGLLSQTGASSKIALNNLTDTTAQIKGTTVENRAKLNQIVSNLNDTTSAVAGITQQTNDLLKSGGLTKNISATVANLKTTTDKLDAIAGSLQNVTTDPKVQSNLKDTLQNIRDTTEQTKYLVERLNHLAGGRNKTAAVVIGPGGAVVVPPTLPSTKVPNSSGAIPLILPRVDFIQNTRADHFRVDLDGIVPLTVTPGAFARAGIYGVGDTNKINLQYGQTLGPSSFADYRYGLYASKLALGGDVGLGRRGTLTFDLYDPNKVHLDAHGVLMLAPELGLLVGGEDLTRRSGGIIGLEYRSTK